MRLARCTLLPLVLLLSCGPALPYYDKAYLPHISPADEADRPALVYTVANALLDGSIRQLEVQTPAGRVQLQAGSRVLATLPLAALVAAMLTRDLYHLGAEWDLVIPTREDGLIPISVYREPDRSMRLVLGPRMPTPEPVALSREDLAARYGTGPLEAGDVDWSNLDLYYLDRALALLTSDEREVLAGVPFTRRHRPVRDHFNWLGYATTAQYFCDNGQVHIEIYDSIHAGDANTFCGDPQHPQPTAAFGVLHEIGHVVSNQPTASLLQRERLFADDHNAKVARYKGLGAADPERAVLEAALSAADRTHAVLRARLEQERRQPAVLMVYLRVRGPVKGPTEYGRISDEESFAESFGLFHVDPAALRRVYPAVYEWLRGGEHMKIMRRASVLAPAGEEGTVLPFRSALQGKVGWIE